MSSNNMAGHVGREITVEALGQSWTFSRWARRIWIDFAEWAKTMLPDPLDVAMNALTKASLKDAEIMRELQRADAKEMARAGADGTPPVLMAGQYKPIGDVLLSKAQELASSYLDFKSPQFTSLLTSPQGASLIMMYLLRAKHPDIDEETAYDVMMALPPGMQQKIFDTTQGKVASATQPKNDVAPAG